MAKTDTASLSSLTRKWRLGYDPWDLGLQTHQVGPEPLLDKMGIEYDPARKYLGKNGKDIGRPGECMYLK